MLKPSFLNVCIFWFAKCIIFYFFLMIINNEFKLLQINNIRNGQDLFYYLWMVLVFPILDIIFFSFPIYYSLKKGKVWLSVIFICFIIEYILFVYSKKRILNTDAIANFIISIIVFFLFFHKMIRSKFVNHK